MDWMLELGVNWRSLTAPGRGMQLRQPRPKEVPPRPGRPHLSKHDGVEIDAARATLSTSTRITWCFALIHCALGDVVLARSIHESTVVFDV